ncbi:hypothetical protein FB566_4447 [Stackebrandtia endophytica]|uniref:Uncharacterized protein n=1 Tax=Stackebrandtia endophytica TaxID=1496996 RepID=A0A543B1Z4_9ACTN|nr:hypothetical protein [Stackebrandtia endophytica]TQL78852.1 hypothetical protein FB566_4447 [Stackebrandtia endophytica]
MITVLLDRDSVGMGDDTQSHLVRWKFPYRATLGDVLLRVIENRYLPVVHGRSVWRLIGTDITVRGARDGEEYLSPGRSGTTFAIMHADSAMSNDGYVAGLTWLWHRGFRDRVTNVYGLETDGVHPLYLRYHAGARSMSFTRFKNQVRPAEPS